MPVRLPIVRDGKIVGVLTAVLAPSLFQDLLQKQRLPAEWISGLVGTAGRLIARIPQVQMGTLASVACRDRIARADEGWYEARRSRGRLHLLHAFIVHGWTILLLLLLDRKTTEL